MTIQIKYYKLSIIKTELEPHSHIVYFHMQMNDVPLQARSKTHLPGILTMEWVNASVYHMQLIYTYPEVETDLHSSVVCSNKSLIVHSLS